MITFHKQSNFSFSPSPDWPSKYNDRHFLEVLKDIFKLTKLTEIKSEWIDVGLFNLGLQINDIILKSIQQIKRQSRRHIKTLSPQQMTFYLESKQRFLQNRQQKLLKQLARQIEKLSEKQKFFVTTISDINSQRINTANNQWHDTFYVTESKRFDVLSKLKQREAKRLQFIEELQTSIQTKLDTAALHRRTYHSFCSDGSKAQSSLDFEQRRQQILLNQETQKNKIDQMLNAKLQKAEKDKRIKSRLIQEVYHSRNTKKQRKIEEYKLRKFSTELNKTQNLRKQLEQDMQKHEKNKKKIWNLTIKSITENHSKSKSRSQSIKMLLLKSDIQQHKKKQTEWKQNELKIIQGRKKRVRKLKQLGQQFKKDQNRKITKVAQKRYRIDTEKTEKTIKILQERIRTEKQAEEIRKSVELKNREKIIIEKIRAELCEMNLIRKQTIQNRNLEKLKQQIKQGDLKTDKLMTEKQQKSKKRERIKTLLRRKIDLITHEELFSDESQNKSTFKQNLSAVSERNRQKD